MSWTTPWAPTAAELNSCIQCGLCLPVCPTFRLTGDEAASPRGRLTAMSAVAAGAPLSDAFEEMMGFCLQCRACEAACPSLVPFGRAMEGARAELAVQRPTRRRRLRTAMVGRSGIAGRTPMRMVTAAAALAQRLGLGRLGGRIGRTVRGLRRLSVRPPTIRGTEHRSGPAPLGRVAVLAGCVMDPWFGGVHQATISLLIRAGYAVSVPDTQGCCGALAAHDGAAATAERLAAVNVAAFAGADVIVANAAGCSAHLKDYGHWAPNGNAVAERARDVTEVVAAAIDSGRLPALPPRSEAVVIHDPCHLRHAQRIFDQPRTIVRAAGYTTVDLDADGLCCGAAGMYSMFRPDTAAQLGRKKADLVRAAGPTLVVSANPGCEMQLRSHLGPDYRILHPVELYASALEDLEPSRPS